MNRRRLILAILVGVIFGAALFGHHLNLNYRSLVASTQNAKPLLDEDTLKSYTQQLVDDLNAKNVDFAIISRAGQARKRLPEGVSYTHSAFWVRTAQGYYDVYNLYHGEDNRKISSLVADAPADFIRPTRAHDVGVILPTKSFQTAMRSYILSDDYGRTHNPSYSLISNPFDLSYQNCNEFVLDELASFNWQEPDTSKIKDRLAKIIEPTVIKSGFVRRHVAPFIDERLVMKDHGKTIATTTREDLIEFLETQNQLDTAYRLGLKPISAYAL